MVLFILSLILVLVTLLNIINPVRKIDVPILYTIDEYQLTLFRHETKDHKHSEYEKIYKTDKGVVIDYGDSVFPAIVYGKGLARFGINDGDKVLVKKDRSMWRISRSGLIVIKKQDAYIILTNDQYISLGIKDDNVELIGIAKWKYKK